jgi:hypothetical protein
MMNVCEMLLVLRIVETEGFGQLQCEQAAQHWQCYSWFLQLLGVSLVSSWYGGFIPRLLSFDDDILPNLN